MVLHKHRQGNKLIPLQHDKQQQQQQHGKKGLAITLTILGVAGASISQVGNDFFGVLAPATPRNMLDRKRKH